MTDIKSLQDRYDSDVEFRTLVRTLHEQLYRTNFTPSELRGAVMLASILFEQNHIKPFIVERF